MFFFQAEDGIRDTSVTGVQTCALPISLKDSSVIRCNTGIASGAPNNEHGRIPPVLIPKITSRFNRILVWFDQDQGGHAGARKYNQKYGWDAIFIPEKFGIKDPFEFISKYGKKEFIQLTKYLTK